MSKELVELKPCPFCGAPARRKQSFTGNHYIVCGNIYCNVRPSTVPYYRMCDATKAWNKRKG